MLSKFKILITIAVYFVIFSNVNFVIAQSTTPSSPSDTSTKAADLQNKIKEYQGKISELQGQRKTLSSQLAVMDNQIKLTEFRISSSKEELEQITRDIEIATDKVTKLEGSLDKITQILLKRVSASYMQSNIQPFEILLASNSMADAFTRAQYLKIVQQNDQKLLMQTVQAKSDYQNQKTIFEDKKEKVESLKDDLEKYTAQLEEEKNGKQQLLSVTKNDEAVYQDLLEKALLEQRAIASITSGGGDEFTQGPVNEGDAIGSMISGASPCSSGTHLHFEVKNGDNRDNPSNYLSNRSVTWNNSPDGQFGFNGSWNWPLSDPISINQGYGITSWSNVYYGGGQHTGIDMSSTSTRSVKAVKSGTLYKGGISCGGGKLLYSRIDHNDGTQSYYLHVN